MANEFPGNQFDGLEPDKQTPRGTKYLGTSTNPWDEIHGTTVSGTTLGAGTAIYLGGVGVARSVQVQDNLEASGKLLTHGLGVQYPVVQVYDGNGSGIPMGSGDAGWVSGMYIQSVEALSTTQMVIYPSVAVSGATVRFVG